MTMTEGQDAYQQALCDFYHGIRRLDVSRFPDKSYGWLRIYETALGKFIRNDYPPLE